MTIKQILYNAEHEEKNDIEIYRFYIGLLRDCPEAMTIKGYDECKAKIAKILQIGDFENENEN